MEFIIFCQDWHDRTKKNSTSPPSATEFDQYNDMILSDLWQMKSSDNRILSPLDDAPVFSSERFISWMYSRKLRPKPTRAARIDLSWLTPAVKALTQTIDDARRFQDMPILADALEDAGCTNAAILNHCRQLGEHVRGCWVLDLLLGKS
jgi:hypothetical protein